MQELSQDSRNLVKFACTRIFVHCSPLPASYLKICENFLHSNCRWSKFVKFSCRENFLFDSSYLTMADQNAEPYLETCTLKKHHVVPSRYLCNTVEVVPNYLKQSIMVHVVDHGEDWALRNYRELLLVDNPGTDGRMEATQHIMLRTR